MTRQEFIKMCGLLGISIPFQSVFASCTSDEDIAPGKFNGTVLIIGAGAAGLTAGYLLNQQGIEFQILEASSLYGGRMKRTTGFADFPIPLGAEWLHIEKGILGEIVNNSSTQLNVETTFYDPNVDYALLEGSQVSLEDVDFTMDQKFINSSWFDFFEQYIVPPIKTKILFNEVVESINYAGDKVLINTLDGEFSADKVIVTVPVKMLQNEAISFTPELPSNKLDAISNVTVWDGFKAFIEFSEKFYPALTAFNIVPEAGGQKLYYDASYGQNSDRHILGFFAVGSGTLPYANLTDSETINYMLNELDNIFTNQASSNYINHITQNWNGEPFINGAYVNDHEDWRRVRTLGESVNNKLFFAGTSYTDGDDWGSVHTAARSAIKNVNDVLK